MSTSRPSIAELRAATQPPQIFERNSGEHWAGRLYIRRLSPYATRIFLRLGLSPDAVTWLFVVAGVGAAALLCLDGDQFAQAVLHAPSTRPDRYTILEHLDLDEQGVLSRIDAYLDAFGR